MQDIINKIEENKKQYFTGQTGVSICTIASFNIGKYIIEKHKLIQEDYLTGETLAYLDKKKKEIEPRNVGIDIDNPNLLKYYADNNYNRMLLDKSTYNFDTNYQDHIIQIFNNSNGVKPEKIVTDYINNVENMYNEFIIQIIHFGSAMVIVKLNNIYYFVDTHAEYHKNSKDSAPYGIIITFDTLDLLINTIVQLRNIMVYPDNEYTKSISIATFVNASDNYQKYLYYMTEYIIDTYNINTQDKLKEDNITILNFDKGDKFQKHFHNWYEYTNNGGNGNNDCLIISFLTLTLPIYYKLDYAQRYEVASHFRRKMLILAPYKNLFDSKIYQDIPSISYLYEEVGRTLAVYFEINLLFISVTLIYTPVDNAYVYQCSPFIDGDEKLNKPIYIICNYGGGHFVAISKEKYIMGNDFYSIVTLSQPTRPDSIWEQVLVIKDNYCQFKQFDIVTYNDIKYFIIYRTVDPDRHQCLSYELVKYDHIKTEQEYLSLTTGYTRVNQLSELHHFLKQYGFVLVTKENMHKIQRYDQKKQREQLLEQMVQLERKITDPRLNPYQNYLIEQHKKFFNI
jgi:hypothetical protein